MTRCRGNLEIECQRPDNAVVGVGGIAVLSKQKNAPLPSQPSRFSPSAIKTKPDGAIIVADRKLLGVPNAMALIPVRLPFGVGSGVFP